MEFPVSPELDQFPLVDGGGVQPSGLLADSEEVVHPWQLHRLCDGLIDYGASHTHPSDCHTGSSGVPLRAPVPVSYYRTVPLPFADDALFCGEEYVGAPFDDDPLSYFREYADVVANEYSAQDDFKLTESEEAELANAYTAISSEQAAEVGLPLEHDVLPCGVSSDDDSEVHTVPTPVQALVSDRRRRGYGSDEERAVRVTQRKSYFRAVADNVGFNTTDPDTITSHDKGRCYVDCLEDYVQWLEEQIRLVGLDPLPLDRVPDYGGLTNRSLRMILVHMQEELFTINLEKVRAEGKFMDLQNAILTRQQAVAADEPRLPYLETGGPSCHVSYPRAT